jgi:hypothetical protein
MKVSKRACCCRTLGGSRRLRRFGFQRAVHPLVPAVLLRMARLDPLDPNPES